VTNLHNITALVACAIAKLLYHFLWEYLAHPPCTLDLAFSYFYQFALVQKHISDMNETEKAEVC